MGIKNLLPFVKPMVITVHIKNFAGQTCAVDASCWLHKGLIIVGNFSPILHFISTNYNT